MESKKTSLMDDVLAYLKKAKTPIKSNANKYGTGGKTKTALSEMADASDELDKELGE